MKLLIASAFMALFAAVPGAAAADSSVRGVVDTYDSQDIESASSSSFDMYSQDSASSASASSFSEDMEMMDFEDELVNNNNMFVTLDRHRHHHRRPTRSPTPRPNNDRDVTFDNGLSQGRQIAQNLWRRMGSSCSAAWKDFPNSIDREIRNFNDGAKAGMKEVLTDKEKECFRDSSEECEDLGNEAARMIANSHCEVAAMSRSRQIRRWNWDCRNIAIDQCKGQVSAQVRRDRDCGARLRSRELLDLQGKCDHKVFDMINGRGEDNDYSEDSESEDYDYSED